MISLVSFLKLFQLSSELSNLSVHHLFIRCRRKEQNSIKNCENGNDERDRELCTRSDDEGESEVINCKLPQPRGRRGDDDKPDQILDPIRQMREVGKEHPLVDAEKFDGSRRSAMLLGVKAVTENFDTEEDWDRDPRRCQVEKKRKISPQRGDVAEPVLGPEEDDGGGFELLSFVFVFLEFLKIYFKRGLMIARVIWRRWRQ